jgi:hypothetical protein
LVVATQAIIRHESSQSNSAHFLNSIGGIKLSIHQRRA